MSNDASQTTARKGAPYIAIGVFLMTLSCGYMGFTLGRSLEVGRTMEATSLLVRSLDNTDRCIAAAKAATHG